MLYRELKAIATKRGMVKWEISGVVEALKWEKGPDRTGQRRGRLMAAGLLGIVGWHEIWVDKKKNYRCVEVPRDGLVTIGELLRTEKDARRMRRRWLSNYFLDKAKATKERTTS